MKKVLFSILGVLSLVMVSCGGADPTVFNDAIIQANNDVSEIKIAYDDKIASAINANDFASIVAETDSALTKIDTELTKVKALKTPKGGEAFKEASIKTFESVRAIVEVGKKFATLTENSTEEEFDQIQKEYNEKEETYSKIFDEMTKAQTDYATSIGYKVQ